MTLVVARIYPSTRVRRKDEMHAGERASANNPMISSAKKSIPCISRDSAIIGIRRRARAYGKPWRQSRSISEYQAES